MASLRQRVLELLKEKPGLTDREITNELLGHDKGQQPVNQICRKLEIKGKIVRIKRTGDRIRNFLSQDQLNITKKPNNHIGVEWLKDFGFVKAGEFIISKSSLANNLTTLSDKTHVLYAFVVKDQIFYIGKTIQKFRNRLNGYRNPGNRQRTNIRINRNLQALLQIEPCVEIFVFVDDFKLTFKNIPINLASGLENSLIDYIQPPWNIL
jgi:hypothetical protein